jgi:hypothetical protein
MVCNLHSEARLAFDVIKSQRSAAGSDSSSVAGSSGSGGVGFLQSSHNAAVLTLSLTQLTKVVAVPLANTVHDRQCSLERRLEELHAEGRELQRRVDQK